MEWTRERCLSLIDIYETHEVLWNPSHGHYYNRDKKHDAWLQIEARMAEEGGTIGELKKKVESLTGSFRREKRKGKKTIGTGKGAREVYVSKWFAFERMSFLLDKDEPKNTFSSDGGCHFSDLDGNDHEDEVDIDGDLLNVNARGPTLNDDSSSAQTEENFPDETAGSSNFEAKRQTKRPSTSNEKSGRIVKSRKEEKTSMTQEALSLLKKAIDKSSPVEKDGDCCSSFGLHIANKLRDYDKKTRDMVEYHINTVLHNADMGNTHLDIRPIRSFENPFSNYYAYPQYPDSAPSYTQPTSSHYPSNYAPTYATLSSPSASRDLTLNPNSSNNADTNSTQ